jgi:hypothetical protein
MLESVRHMQTELQALSAVLPSNDFYTRDDYSASGRIALAGEHIDALRWALQDAKGALLESRLFNDSVNGGLGDFDFGRTDDVDFGDGF